MLRSLLLVMGFSAAVTTAQKVDFHSNVSKYTLDDFSTTNETTTERLPDAANDTVSPPSSNGGQANGVHVQIMSDEQRQLAEGILGNIGDTVVPFAIIVTVINVVVFMHKSMRSSTSYYVVGLSTAQLIYLGLDLGQEFALLAIGDGNPAESYGYFFYGIYVLNPGISVIRRGSYVVMCLVSLERIYAIARPLHIKEFILVRRPVLFIVGSYLVTAAFHFYIFCKLGIMPMTLPSGVTVYYLYPKDIYMRYRSVIEAFDVNAKVMFSYIPLLSLMGLNLVTLVLLKRHNLERQKMNMASNSEEEAKKQRQLTVTILGATVCYVVLSVPFACHALVAGFHPEFSRTGKERNLYIFLLNLSYAAVLISCFTDFVSFLLLSSAYRRTFVTLFRLNKLLRKTKQGPAGEDSTGGISGSNTHDTLVASG